MPNTTLEKKVALERGNDISPEIGYEMVIFKQGRFDRIILEGDTFNPGFFNRKKFRGMTVLAISTDPNILLPFRRECTHQSQVHNFFLDYEINIKVVDAKLVAEKLKSDPVNKLIRKIHALLKPYFSSGQWDEVFDAGKFNQKVERLSDSYPNHPSGDHYLGILEAFAMDYGLQLNELTITRALPEVEIEGEAAGVETKKQIKVLQAEHELEMERKRLAEESRHEDRVINQKDQFWEATTTTIKTAIENIGQDIDNIDDLAENINKGQKLFQQMGSENRVLGTSQKSQHLLSNPKTASLFEKLSEHLVNVSSYDLSEKINRSYMSILFQSIGLAIETQPAIDQDTVRDLYLNLSIPSELRNQTNSFLSEIFTHFN